MSAGLHEELDRVARRVPVGPPPADLWRRGTRRRRRRVAGACVAVLTCVGLVVVPRSSVVPSHRVHAPFAASHDADVPDRLSVPDPRTPGTDDTGPIGPVAALVGAPRRSGAVERDGVAAVSATTGRYAFLDLPGFPFSGSCGGSDRLCALSPDGRTVAYWTFGGRPRHRTGVAAYDTVTGTVRRLPVPARIDTVEAFTWISQDTLLLRWSARTAQGAVRLWSPGHGGLRKTGGAPGEDVVAADPPGVTMFAAGGAPTDGLLLLAHDASYVIETRPVRGLTMDQRHRVSDAVVGPTRAGFHRVSDSIAAFVVRDRADELSGRLYLGRVPARGAVNLRAAPTALRPSRILGWRDATHVVVDGSAGEDAGAFSVDTATGRSVRLVSVDPMPLDGPVYASDLWRRPTMHRPAPPAVTGSRLYAAGAVGATVLAGTLVLWRRRRGRL